MARIVVFTMSYRDLCSTKTACCEILETILDAQPKLSELSEMILVSFTKPSQIIFGAKKVIIGDRETPVKQIDRFEIPEGLSEEQWVELLGIELRMFLRISGFRCDHETRKGHPNEGLNLIFWPATT